jgi:hypothetical protein
MVLILSDFKVVWLAGGKGGMGKFPVGLSKNEVPFQPLLLWYNFVIRRALSNKPGGYLT